MDYVNIILGIIIIGLLWIVWKCYQKSELDKKEITATGKERDEYVELGKGLVEYNEKLQEKKNLAKDKILELVKAREKISNNDVVKLLEVSSSTVVRYLDELEKEGKIKQIGKTGKKVYYTL